MNSTTHKTRACTTDKKKMGITFIALDAETAGQKFRHALQEAMGQAIKS